MKYHFSRRKSSREKTIDRACVPKWMSALAGDGGRSVERDYDGFHVRKDEEARKKDVRRAGSRRIIGRVSIPYDVAEVQ